MRYIPVYQRFKLLDWSLIYSVLLLNCIGLIVLYSAADGNILSWPLKQFMRFSLGFFTMLLIAVVPWNIWRALSYGGYIISILMLIYVDLFGHIGMGAQRWINLYFIQIQPSEVVKITIVLALARYYSSVYFKPDTLLSHISVIVMFINVPVLLVLRQPDLGTAMILLIVGFTIVFLAGLNWKYFAGGGIALTSAFPFLWNNLYDYQRQRILTFLNPENDPLGSGYHIIQSKIAIGSAGIFGKGFMKGSQNKLDFLPEKQTDFIFTTFTEEFGFIGALLLITAYLIMFYCCYRIILRLNQTFPRLMVAGLTVTFFLYFFINIGMVIGIMPVVGVPLPLMTYGGTATLTMMMSIGLILSADLSTRMKHSTFHAV